MAEPVAGADNYQIGDIIAQGGMGSILEAVDGKLQRTVAVKVMTLDADTDPQIRERFLQEARVLATLEHPNIVPIHDVVWENGVPLFYTMKLVKGRSLEQVLLQIRSGDADTVREFTLDRLLLVFRKVCDAVAFAHSKGVLHRDLKPANVMIGEFGEVLVMDWGLAKQLMAKESADTGAAASASVSSQHSATLHGVVLGSPAYMPPEQAQGTLQDLDERSDVYSLGAILYAILTLRRPVEGKTTTEVLQRVINGQIVPLVKLPDKTAPKPLPHLPGGQIPAALAAVVMRALSYEPARRYPDVLAFGADIEAYQSGHATQAENASALRQFWLLMKRHRTAAAALALILGLSLGFTFQLLASERGARTAETEAVRERDNARQALALARIANADAAYHEGNGSAMKSALDLVPETLRDMDWQYLRARMDTCQATMDSSAGIGCGVAAHPTLPGVFAVALTTRRIALVEARTGKELRSFPVSARQQKDTWYRSLDFSPDGKRLLVGALQHSSVAIYEVETGAVLAEWDAQNVNWVRFSGDGTRTLDVSGQNTLLSVHDAATGSLLWSLPTYSRAIFLPDGSILTSHYNRLQQLDGSTGAVLRKYPKQPASLAEMILSPDGKTVFFSGWDNRVRGMTLADGSLVFEQPMADGTTFPRLALSADGRQIVGANSLVGDLRLIRVWDTRTGKVLRHLLGGSTKLEGVAIHPLSGEIMVSGVENKLWAAAVDVRAPRWEISPASYNSSVFCGSDDVFMARCNLRILEPGGRHHAQVPDLPDYAFGNVAAAAMGDQVAVARDFNEKYTLTVYHRSSNGFTPVCSLPNSSRSAGLQFSPDARYLAMADLNNVSTFALDIATGKKLPRCSVKGIQVFRDMSWLGTSRLVALAYHGPRKSVDQIIVWDAATSQVQQKVSGPCALERLAVAPDARTLAEGGTDKRIRIRDAQTLAVLREFRAHDGPITAIAYHPSAPVLATGSADRTIRLWNLEDLSLLEELRPSDHNPRSLHFSPSGKRLASCDAVGVARIWELEVEGKE